jgi:hypothetical protein
MNPAPAFDTCPSDIHHVLKSVVSGAQSRARRAGRPFDPELLSLVFALYVAQGGRCALSGLCFDLRIIGSGKARRPFAPSLDRIDSTGGYTRDNVRLVCQAVNFALNAYGEDTFREIAAATVAFEPAALAPADQSERQRKSAYIDHVVREAPNLLAGHGGELPKPRMRELLRKSFEGALPVDEANAYGWGFRRLTEVGVIEPASGSTTYRLRSVRLGQAPASPLEARAPSATDSIPHSARLTPDEREEIERALKNVRVLEARRRDEAPND